MTSASADQQLHDLGYSIERGGAELLPELEALWLAFFDQRIELGAAGFRTVDRDKTWPLRRAHYETLLHDERTLVTVLRKHSQAVGYGVTTAIDAMATWNTGPAVGLLETLILAESERGHGVGSLLLDAVEQQLARDGVPDVLAEVMVGNDAAQRLYERRGMVEVQTRLFRQGPPPHPAPPAPEGFEFVVGRDELLERVAPLWVSLYDHHSDTGAGVVRLRPREQTWPHRRAQYEQFFANDADARFVLVVLDGDDAGYAMVRGKPGPDDTWVTGKLIGEIETLSLKPGVRGRGLGSALLDKAEEVLEAMGAPDVTLERLAGNDSAARFYERRGMRPATIGMLRLGPRPERG